MRKSLHIQAYLILLHFTLLHFEDNLVDNEIVVFMAANTIYILQSMFQGVILTSSPVIEEIHFQNIQP